MRRSIERRGKAIPLNDYAVECHEPKSDLEWELYYKLRYDVYVEELNVVSKNDLPIKAGVEFDEYDTEDKSIVFLVLAKHPETKDEKIIGCLRLILGNKSKLPCEDHFDINYSFERNKAAEISRLIIANEFRHYYFRDAILKLTWEVRQYCIKNKLDECLATMELLTFRILNMMGFPILQIGPKIFYFERERIPVVFRTEDILSQQIVESVWGVKQ